MDGIVIRLNPIDSHHIPNNRLLSFASTHRTIIKNILDNKTFLANFRNLKTSEFFSLNTIHLSTKTGRK